MDLPGLQAYPEEDRVQSEGLVNKYIKGKDVLVLCVVPATDDTLDKGPALRVLSVARKLPNTILALTKCDKVHEDDLADQILERILLQSETSPHRLPGLRGCVAVMNRKQQDGCLSLEEAALREKNLFSKILDHLPERFRAADVRQQLQNSMTSKQLMVALDGLYHSHIVSDWRDNLLEELMAEQQKAVKDEEALGPDPTTVNAATVMDKLYDEVSCHANPTN